MNEKHIIVGVHVSQRVKNAVDVQKILTEYGCYIKTRLGLHDVGASFCAPGGLLLMEMFGDEAKIDEMEQKLLAVAGLEVQRMVFTH